MEILDFQPITPTAHPYLVDVGAAVTHGDDTKIRHGARKSHTAGGRQWGSGTRVDLDTERDSVPIMADWDIRPATATDIEPIAELRAVVMRPDLERLGRYDEHRVRQRFRDGFDAAHTWVIEVNAEFAGCVALRPAEDAHWLEHFYLAPRFQGTGIGSGVLSDLLERRDGTGVRVVRLNVLQGSPARRLYERHGFGVEREDAVDVFMVRAGRTSADAV